MTYLARRPARRIDRVFYSSLGLGPLPLLTFGIIGMASTGAAAIVGIVLSPASMAVGAAIGANADELAEGARSISVESTFLETDPWPLWFWRFRGWLVFFLGALVFSASIYLEVTH